MEDGYLVIFFDRRGAEPLRFFTLRLLASAV